MSITSAGCSGQLSHLLAPELCGGQKGGSPEEPQTHSHYTIPRERVGVAVMSDPPLSALPGTSGFWKTTIHRFTKTFLLGGSGPPTLFLFTKCAIFSGLGRDSMGATKAAGACPCAWGARASVLCFPMSQHMLRCDTLLKHQNPGVKGMKKRLGGWGQRLSQT